MIDKQIELYWEQNQVVPKLTLENYKGILNVSDNPMDIINKEYPSNLEKVNAYLFYMIHFDDVFNIKRDFTNYWLDENNIFKTKINDEIKNAPFQLDSSLNYYGFNQLWYDTFYRNKDNAEKL